MRLRGRIVLILVRMGLGLAVIAVSAAVFLWAFLGWLFGLVFAVYTLAYSPNVTYIDHYWRIQNLKLAAWVGVPSVVFLLFFVPFVWKDGWMAAHLTKQFAYRVRNLALTVAGFELSDY